MNWKEIRALTDAIGRYLAWQHDMLELKEKRRIKAILRAQRVKADKPYRGDELPLKATVPSVPEDQSLPTHLQSAFDCSKVTIKEIK